MNEQQINLLSVTEIMMILNCQRITIYSAIKKGRLKAIKRGSMLYITEDNLKTYLLTKYSRDHSMFNGELLYDKSKGEYSIRNAAHELGCSYNHVYYLLSKGYLRFKTKGLNRIIMKEDLDEYMKKIHESQNYG
jgi:excisionase family DNA binding protein